MAKAEHLKIIKQGVSVWNDWRKANPEVIPDFSGANLSKADLYKANLVKANLMEANLFRTLFYEANLMDANLKEANLKEANLSRAFFFGANLSEADLSKANLMEAYLKGANLTKANLNEADLSGADLTKANLTKADFNGADLSGADLTKANLTKADLNGANLNEADLSGAKLIDASIERANLVETNLKKADLTNCRIYGISAWNVKLDKDTKQSDLVITREEESIITVDNLEVAQFIYLLLHNEKIRDVIDTITSKAVLILGRFTPERMAILNAIREELRNRDYLPILFNFEGPTTRDITETVSTLAHMARFVVADITDAKSIPQELKTIVPNLPSVPVQPILLHGKDEYGMFEHFKRYPWVLSTHQYKGIDDLKLTLGKKVLAPAEAKVKEIRNE